jgi:fido (protein-threonine AMPylation protein)
MDAHAQIVAMPDGRRLCFAEWGSLDGIPILSMHGTPGCRLLDARRIERRFEDLLAELGIRLVTYDRPGYGRSDRHRGRKVADTAGDVAAIADALEMERFAVVGGSSGSAHASIAIPPAELTDRVGSPTIPMAALGVGTLALLHRTLLEPATEGLGGQLRSVNVWIGDPANPTFNPPAPEDVPKLTAELVDHWRREYFSLAKASHADIVAGLAKLHHGLTAIHPFLDGNGRVARVLVDLAAQELLGQRVGTELTADHAAYFSSLRAADQGDLGPLERLIAAALT